MGSHDAIGFVAVATVGVTGTKIHYVALGYVAVATVGVTGTSKNQ